MTCLLGRYHTNVYSHPEMASLVIDCKNKPPLHYQESSTRCLLRKTHWIMTMSVTSTRSCSKEVATGQGIHNQTGKVPNRHNFCSFRRTRCNYVAGHCCHTSVPNKSAM
ncbi:unnamed protein product [Ixodes pacificus]